MITPAYALTSTERVLPLLALDFTTGTLDPRVTVTRALNTATVTNNSGYIQTINADLPRFDYNPTTLESRGLLIEESRANICLYSEDFRDTASAGSTRPWSYVRCSVTADSVASPSGLVNADTLVEDTSASSTHILQQIISKAASSITYTASVYVKRGSRDYVQLWMTGSSGGANSARASFDLINGVVGVTGTLGTGWTAGTANISVAANGFYRCSFSFTTGTELSVYAWILPCTSTALSSVFYTGNGSNSLYLYGAQVEVGAFATSYIPTTTTSLTRNADAVSMTGTNFSDWYNQSEGAFFIKQSLIGASGNQSGLTVLGTAYNNNAFHYMASYNSTRRPFWLGYTGTTNDVSLYLFDAVALETQYGVCFTYKQDNFAAAKIGETPRTDTSGGVYTSMSQLLIGYGQQYLNGHIQQIKYWPHRLTDNEVQVFSKG